MVQQKTLDLIAREADTAIDALSRGDVIEALACLHTIHASAKHQPMTVGQMDLIRASRREHVAERWDPSRGPYGTVLAALAQMTQTVEQSRSESLSDKSYTHFLEGQWYGLMLAQERTRTIARTR